MTRLDTHQIRSTNDRFATTHWSAVLASAEGAADALERLCASYWYPLYAHVRRQGASPHDAEDLTQEFFAWLLVSRHLGVADPELGKFRSFLLVRLDHFLSDQRKKARAQKRGGGKVIVSLDAELAEARYHLEPASELTPEKHFDLLWALTLMEQTVARLRGEYVTAGRAELFEELKHFQPGEEATKSYAVVGARLGLSESAMKSAIFRLRRRHREILREEIAQTVATAAEVDEEIRYLIAVIAG